MQHVDVASSLTARLAGENACSLQMKPVQMSRFPGPMGPILDPWGLGAGSPAAPGV